MSKFTDLLTSRKFWLTVASIAAVIQVKGLKASTLEIIIIVSTYIASLTAQNVAMIINPPKDEPTK